MQNTLLVDVDLVYQRPAARADDDDLVEIDFEDMTPLDDPELVGDAPLEANAYVPLADYDLVGVRGHSAVAVARSGGRPFEIQLGAPRPEELETEEFTAELRACS